MAGIGEALRSTRERRGLSIDQVAQETRISPRFLEALEAEQFQELPAPVYVRGFLRSYANYLQLDPQALLDQLVGGNNDVPGARSEYVGGNGRNGHTPRRNTDPFRRTGVVAAPPTARRAQAAPSVHSVRPVEDEGWAPEPLAPIAPPHQDHGYIPGSDLMEAPEYGPDEEYEEHVYEEPQPRFERRTAGVLAERPPSSGEPGMPRRVALFGGGVVAVLAFLGMAVLLTRDDSNGDNSAAASEEERPGVTPGTVISGAGGTKTAAAASGASPSASAAASGTVQASVSPGASTTPGTTPTPGATTVGGATTSPTATPTVGATNTPAPTATPTTAPIPTATPIPVRPESHGFGECRSQGPGIYDCGAPPYRVICYTPFGYPQNSNWWVDVDRSFGELPSGWREYTDLWDTGDIIKAGQTFCATP